MTLLQTAVDTILQCFLVDEEFCKNNPSAQPYCTKSLRKFIDEERNHRYLCHLCSCLTCDCCGTGVDESTAKHDMEMVGQ
jgi:hypothetical protein